MTTPKLSLSLMEEYHSYLVKYGFSLEDLPALLSWAKRARAALAAAHEWIGSDREDIAAWNEVEKLLSECGE